MPIVQKGSGQPVRAAQSSQQTRRIESQAEVAAVIVEVALPKDLYDSYNQAAIAQGVSLEDAIISRMRRCKGHDSVRGLWLGDADRKRVEQLLKKAPLETASQLLGQLESVFSVRVEPFDPIEISGAAFKRITLRDGYGGMTAQQHVEKMVKDAIARSVGAV